MHAKWQRQRDIKRICSPEQLMAAPECVTNEQTRLLNNLCSCKLAVTRVPQFWQLIECNSAFSLPLNAAVTSHNIVLLDFIHILFYDFLQKLELQFQVHCVLCFFDTPLTMMLYWCTEKKVPSPFWKCLLWTGICMQVVSIWNWDACLNARISKDLVCKGEVFIPRRI